MDARLVNQRDTIAALLPLFDSMPLASADNRAGGAPLWGRYTALGARVNDGPARAMAFQVEFDGALVTYKFDQAAWKLYVVEPRLDGGWWTTNRCRGFACSLVLGCNGLPGRPVVTIEKSIVQTATKPTLRAALRGVVQHVKAALQDGVSAPEIAYAVRMALDLEDE